MHDAMNAVAGGLNEAPHDCWRTIGVRGDKTCPKLAEHAHCRNCPVYSAAATQLLDRDLPPGYLAEWAAHFAKSKPIEEHDTQTAIVFRIASEWFAFSTIALDEVSEQRPIHSLPHQRGAVLGLVNVRGELLMCVSLAKMLGVAAAEPQDRASIGKQRLIVVRTSGKLIAFPVNEVLRIHRFHPRDLESAPATIHKSSASYTKAILRLPNKTIGYLDHELLIQALSRSVA
jgi:chemotaxis-related protein WspD